MPEIPPELKALTPKQRAFVLSYVKDKNGTQSAREAGYSGDDNALAAAASRMLRTPKVRQAIDSLIAPAVDKAMITVERVINELAELGFGDMSDVLNFDGPIPCLKLASEITPRGRKLISSMKVKRHFEGGMEDGHEVEVTEFKLWDKISALKHLGDHVGAFKKEGDQGDTPSIHVHLSDKMTPDDARQFLNSVLKR